MSFDLAVFAAEPGADEASARVRMERCNSLDHEEGDLDERIVAFYEELRARYPDHRPYDYGSSPWASTPLSTGIDHVFMSLKWSADLEAIRTIQRLAATHGLVLHDRQDDTIYLPPR